jgi:hypothetical protein
MQPEGQGPSEGHNAKQTKEGSWSGGTEYCRTVVSYGAIGNSAVSVTRLNIGVGLCLAGTHQPTGAPACRLPLRRPVSDA